MYSLGDVDIHIDNEYAFRFACRNGRIEIAKWLCSICDNYEYTKENNDDDDGYTLIPIIKNTIEYYIKYKQWDKLVEKSKMIKALKISGLLTGIILGTQGCVSVKAYQKVYLNDEDMKLGFRKIEVFETNFQSYREGASGANGGKTGGGCGCN